MDIKVLATMNPNMASIMFCQCSARAVLHFGLVRQFHYVSLVPLATSITDNTCGHQLFVVNIADEDRLVNVQAHAWYKHH